MKIPILLFLSLCATLHAAEKPNFLMIYADDLGYGDVSTYHESDVSTPNIDRLAKEGMLFTRMRANCTVCSPSRAALLTGIYADRAGVPGVIRTDPDSSWGYLNPALPTLADKLKEAGYTTAIIGKWHLGLESPNIPNERGFDHFHGFLGDMMDSFMSHRRNGKNFMRLNSETIDPKGHATELFSEWACDYLREQKGSVKPFFLYLAYNAPHFPIEPPKEWFEKTKARSPGLNAKRAKNVAFVEHLDHYIGTVLAALKESGQEENTVVVFTSDNGGSLPHAQNNDPWRGGKQDHYDGGLKIPFMVRWPGKIKAGTNSEWEGLVFDVFPTFLELAGVAPTPGLDAKSLVPILQGKEAERPGDLYFVRREGGQAYMGKSYEAVVKDGWKLMQNDPFSPLELYHLSVDPKEQENLVDKEKAKVTELSALLRQHIAEGGATPWRPKSSGN
jgi:arylsulfatase A-like enzyme